MKKVTSQFATNPIEEKLTPLQLTLEKCKQAFYVVFVFSLFVNLLMLITPLYSLQVLDRVIGSGNMATLLMLSLIIGTIYLSYSLLQIGVLCLNPRRLIKISLEALSDMA